MWTECSPALFEFAPVESHAVVAGFDGGAIASDAGGLPLGSADRAAGLVERFAACFTDARAPDRVEHGLATLVGQRRFGRPTAWPPSPVGTPSATSATARGHRPHAEAGHARRGPCVT
ncbi:MAG: transposase [Acetobacteraceae bacterium]|nr:transposase [Acetobacteraceae bacterium]